MRRTKKKSKKHDRKPSKSSAVLTSIDEEKRFCDLVSIGNLRNTWKQVRREIREHRIRDCIDWLDWAVSIETCLPQLQNALLSGEYTPLPPMRYELAKSKGAFRIITFPNIRDILVYYLICDKALELATTMKVPGSFFSRKHKATPVGKAIDSIDEPSSSFFSIWLRYQQYRTRTMLNKPYEVLVVSDITNYFDSISHELLMEYLSPLGLPRKAVGILGRLLETLKPTAGHSPNPRIGIPVDECECSRTLAHIYLFEHDRRMVKEFGEKNYVRWMDDQNIGAKDHSDARKIVNCLNRSLSSQRLTINSGKTLFLTPPEVVDHFQLDANEALDKWNDNYKNRYFLEARKELEELWKEIKSGSLYEKGSWDKILKRFYAYTARVGSNILDDRMYKDLIRYPHLDERIFLSLARRDEGMKLIDLFTLYCNNGESLYESTEAVFFDACLLLNASPSTEAKIRELACKFSEGQIKGQSQKPFGKSSALLCLYCFNYKQIQFPALFTADQAPTLPSVLARAWLAVVAARVPHNLAVVQTKLVGHPSDDVARLSRFLNELLSGKINQIGNYKRQKSRWPATGKFYDTRAWLQLELLSNAQSRGLRRVAKADVRAFEKLTRTRQEKRVLKRIKQKLM